ncbi:MAG: hypothetical protein WC223_10220 [Bacteroidales bacterium]|jgi:hypothetical protein
MRKIILLILIILPSLFSIAQNTAIEFKYKDSLKTQQSLFDILDKGNIVILIYEHQCPACTKGSQNVKEVILKYYSDKKNIKIIYLDNGANSLSSTKNWIKKNSLLNGECVKYSTDYSSPYGEGMPVIVITAGKSHKIFLISNSPSDISTLNKALINAFTEISEMK